ncbi:uncharacterized protein DNG_03137 [Cephalotrichum gorgonifer]|uniref:Heterokaryon incompatibility domain-containing protein n=1 Tax=Cephalotrichum gorgonifer TaxID=2041049 RepID=A0AAE8STY6_9PEZI|nr:uncharacterized protein DNG_03137 [Cephalotrichum gorgonifer]
MTSVQRFTNPKWMGYQHRGHPWTSFSNYPRQRGFTAEYIRHRITLGDKEPVERMTLNRDGVAFYLSWHTFGLLEAVFCRNVQEALLLKEPANGQVEMTLDSLKPMLQSWAVHVSEMPGRSYCHGYLDHVAATQRHAYNQFISLVAGDRLDYPGSDYIEIRRLMNYVACLGEALWVTTAGLFYRFIGPDSIPSALSWHSVPALGDDSLHSAVVADGWCPSTVNYLNLSANLSTLRLALFHGPLYEERHPECSAEKCTLTQVDTENYVVQHTSQGCGCSFVGPDIHSITELLGQSSIPVIRINKGEGADNPVSISVLDGSSVEFVAFSHVWADGLGSTSEVGLPICQLRRLADMASNLVEDGAFWIDGLCVPEESDLRNLAIKMMADTYRRAKAVLVLDSGISTISTTDRTEIMLRVCISRWMRRLWTFQEAVLAKELYFKLADRVVLIDSIIPEFKDQLVDPALTGLGLFLATLTAHAQNQLFNITDVARAIQWRDTSKKADETLAVASLLNISAFKLACAAPDDRMRLLLLGLENLPRGLPFMQVEKLRSPGFTWAPSTFLYPSGQSMPRLDTEATCTPEGLMSNYYALIFDEERPVRWVKGVAIRGRMQGLAYEAPPAKELVSGRKNTKRVVFKDPATVPKPRPAAELAKTGCEMAVRPRGNVLNVEYDGAMAGHWLLPPVPALQDSSVPSLDSVTRYYLNYCESPSRVRLEPDAYGLG